MKTDLANFSTDLRRVSYWIYEGRINLAINCLKDCRQKYHKVNSKTGGYKNIWDEVKKIESLKDNASERALTLSIILKNRALI